MKNFATVRQSHILFKKKINHKIYDWVMAAAEDGKTNDQNKNDLDEILIKPRLLSKTGLPKTSTKFFNFKIESPLILAPMGHQTQFHKDGEIEMCKGATNSKIIASFGTQSRMKLDDIKNKNKKSKIIWTIFPFGDFNWIKKQIKNAEKNRAIAIALCLDANVRSHRYQDMENFYDARKVGKRTNPISPSPKKSYFYDWNLVKKIVKLTKLPVIPKGVLTYEDTLQAIKNGCKGIWISNHGGRMFNSGISTSYALINIQKKLKKKKLLKIIDGGVTKGTDIMKYLCMGADLVAVGRPAIYGLSVNGNKGVSQVFDILKKELLVAMINGGFKDLNSFKKNRLILSKFSKKYG